MIYEKITDALVSLSNTWLGLADSLRRLQEHLDETGLNILVYGPLLDELIRVCDDPNVAPLDLDHGYRQQIEIIITGGLLGFNLIDARDEAMDAFFQSRIAADDLRQDFENLPPNGFGPPPSVRDTVEISELTISRAAIRQLLNFIQLGLQEFEEIDPNTDIGQKANVQGIRSSVDHLASYPMLTSELGNPPVFGSGGGGAASAGQVVGGANAQRTVETAMRKVLGRVPRPQDTRSFLTALRQSFDLKQKEGHIEFSWTPRSYAGQTELGGGVAGAQASLYNRARVALDYALPILDGLYPLLPDYDPEETAAVREIVRAELNEIVNEFGVEGGPRVSRVDGLFLSLLSERTLSGLGAQGHLYQLRDLFGLTQDRINTLEEEVDVTNFIVLEDYIRTLGLSWIDFRNQWLGRDLGTRLVLLSRALSVSDEAVDEIYAAMDSVFIGPAERQVISFRDARGRNVLVEELLSWVKSFTASEAPHLVFVGGRRGVQALVPTAQRLLDLLTRLTQTIPFDTVLPDGLRHPRVLHALQELRGYLQQVVNLSQDVQRPLRSGELAVDEQMQNLDVILRPIP